MMSFFTTSFDVSHNHRWIQPVMYEGGQAAYFGSEARPKGPKPENQRTDRGGEVPARKFGEVLAVSCPHGVRSKGFLADGVSWNLLGAKFGRGYAPVPHPPQVRIWSQFHNPWSDWYLMELSHRKELLSLSHLHRRRRLEAVLK